MVAIWLQFRQEVIMPKLTKRTIDSLPPSQLKTGELHWDTELKGFGIRVFPSGRKTFVIKFRASSGVSVG